MSITIASSTSKAAKGGALAALADICSHGLRDGAESREEVILVGNAAQTEQKRSSSKNIVTRNASSMNELVTSSPSADQHNMISEILSASISLTILSKSANEMPTLRAEVTCAPTHPPCDQHALRRTPYISPPLVVYSHAGPIHPTATDEPVSILRLPPNMLTGISPTERARLEAELQDKIRFREYQVNTWTQRLQQVQRFVSEYGHCMIPSDYPPNQKLAKWAKRQRYQYQLFQSNPAKSSMTAERIQVLNNLGFCWQNKISVWHARYQELLEFKKEVGHTQVPSEYKPNQKLATWVKCQRRQKRLGERGKSSSMTDDRVAVLDAVHFSWQLYPSSPRDKINSCQKERKKQN